MRDLAPCHTGLVRVALAPCSPPLSPVDQVVMEVGATQPGPMKSWGESGAMFRCSGHGADKKMRTDKGSPSMAWKLSAMHPSLFSPPSSFQLPQFPVKETWAGNLRAAAHYMKGRPKCIKGTRRAHGSEEGGGERGEGRRLGFEEQRDACTVPIDEIHPQRNPRPITACRSSGHPSRHHFVSSCCLWAQRGRPEGRGRCGALQWTAQARDSPGSLWDICFAFFLLSDLGALFFLGPLFPSTYAVGTQ